MTARQVTGRTSWDTALGKVVGDVRVPGAVEGRQRRACSRRCGGMAAASVFQAPRRVGGARVLGAMEGRRRRPGTRRWQGLRRFGRAAATAAGFGGKSQKLCYISELSVPCRLTLRC
jgi:hypothetical protein